MVAVEFESQDRYFENFDTFEVKKIGLNGHC